MRSLIHSTSNKPSDIRFRYDDNCGVYWPFLPERNVPVECNSDESHTPGTFCVKIVKQGPRGFICENEEQYHVNFVM